MKRQQIVVQFAATSSRHNAALSEQSKRARTLAACATPSSSHSEVVAQGSTPRTRYVDEVTAETLATMSKFLPRVRKAVAPSSDQRRHPKTGARQPPGDSAGMCNFFRQATPPHTAAGGVPSNWTESSEILVPLTPHDEEYWEVSDHLKDSMDDTHVAMVWRVQNRWQWSHYEFHKQRFEALGIESNEHWVWHGTKTVDPSVIYANKLDGFMVQCAKQGAWGRGLYFAESSSYSHDYSSNPSADFSPSDREGGRADERELNPGETGGALITKAQYANFDFRTDFALVDKTNSGILYLAPEVAGAPIWNNAPEYQLLDDPTYIELQGAEMMTGKLTGDVFGLYDGSPGNFRPGGQWNSARIVHDKGRVTHYLNDKEVLTYTIGSPEWDALIATTKFKAYPGFARAERGHIGFQDHGQQVYFKNIRIRSL